MGEVLQIRVELLGVPPTIWRRIRIEGECTFWDLHVALQNAMGWTDSHLHAFHVQDAATGQLRHIGLHVEDDMIDDEDAIEPGWEVRVQDLLSVARSRMVYEYDFGDSWEHAVVLEDVLPSDGGRYPRCLGGARACPPEDVGGGPGYAEFLAAIADPEHAQHERLLEWVGGRFDPEAFDAGAVIFEDPDERFEEVFGDDEPGVGDVVQIEGGFTSIEIRTLLEEPFAETSPLRLITDLPDAEYEVAPLLPDMGRFLRALADTAPLKLTQTGNLPRRMIATLIEAQALGDGWWRTDRGPRNEDDVPRATLLRGLAEVAGLTRKLHGKLLLTKRGEKAAAGRIPASALYRLLLERYVVRFNWAFGDAMPQSRWLQAAFWYGLYLLQAHGKQRLPSTFYVERLELAFPWMREEFAQARYGHPRRVLAHAVEHRLLEGFAQDLGLACTESEDGLSVEPCQVWAGPLLAKVVAWRRESGP